MTICKHGLRRNYTNTIKTHNSSFMPFDCPSARGWRGVEIGFYLIITDVPLCCAVCPVPT